MVDDIPIQLLEFNFASRSFYYNCLAQGLNNCDTGDSLIVNHCLDHGLALDVSMQFTDDFAARVNNFDGMITALRKKND